MTKSPIQIASDIVSDCPGTFKMTSGQRQLLVGMIAEELKKQRKQWYENGRYDNSSGPPNTRHGGT